MNGAECKAWINLCVFMVVYISEGYHYRRSNFVAQKDHFVVLTFVMGSGWPNGPAIRGGSAAPVGFVLTLCLL